MGQQYNNPKEKPKTQNPGQKMPGQQDDNRRQVQGNPNEPNRTGKTPGSKTPGREHGE